MDHRPARRIRQVLTLRKHLRSRARRVAPVRLRVEDQIRDDERRDIVQHQRRDDLVGGEKRSEERRDERERGTADRSRGDHRGDRHPARVVADRDAGGRAGRGTDVELALTADVEELHAKRDGRAEPGEDQRRRGDERGVEGLAADEPRVEDPAKGGTRRVMGDQKDDGHHPERDDHRSDRDRHREPLRLREPPLDPHQEALPPAMSRPISSTVADAASSSPTIAPSYMTAMRSASARISSRSSEMRSTPTPSAAAARR